MALTRTLAATLAALGVTATLAACVTEAPGPAAMIYPGKEKTATAFQQDQAICQQHAVAQTGYGEPSAPAPLAPASVGPAQSTTDIGFMQCMAARGDVVQMAPTPSPYAYSAPYPYPYAGYDPGYGLALGGIGFVGGYGLHHGLYNHGGPHDGGFHGGGPHDGGFHGGGPHAGGFHTDGAHAGGFQGGFHPDGPHAGGPTHDGGSHAGGFQGGFHR